MIAQRAKPRGAQGSFPARSIWEERSNADNGVWAGDPGRRADGRGRGECDDGDEPGHQAGRQDRRRAGVQRVGLHRQERSPALSWSGAPKTQKSFAVSMYDPDAPTGSGFWHWWSPISGDRLLATERRGRRTRLPNGAVQSHNDFSLAGYGGPCPPKGKPHRYVITVCAQGRQARCQQQSLAGGVRLLRQCKRASEGDAHRPRANGGRPDRKATPLHSGKKGDILP